jgi:dCMP deaminase
MPNCDEGGCERCANPGKFESGTGYDVCICVHAEQNAILTAARFGISIDGATLYSTTRPCFGCTKELLQAGIRKVFFLHDWSHPNAELQHEFVRLHGRFPEGIRHLMMDDPKSEWASGRGGRLFETGHSIPGNEGDAPPIEDTEPKTR